ncbi:MAG: hypothetical protein LVR00_07760 [Rhabdochlamydiaceae bacterium]|jgi:hypothetical protein
MEIPLFEYGRMNHYIVDHVFTLWGGLPSFGLVPKDKESLSFFFGERTLPLLP